MNTLSWWASAMSGCRWRSRWREREVTGLDIDAGRDRRASARDRQHPRDRSRGLAAALLALTAEAECAGADIYIVTVPTPVDDSNQPDLGPVIAATRTRGLLDPARKPIIVYESTVYPGVTEDICGP